MYAISARGNRRLIAVHACHGCRRPVTPLLTGTIKEWRARWLVCPSCKRKAIIARRPLQLKALAIVGRAIKQGVLARPYAFACVDCGKRASQYDHRDYRRPLDVAPVCVGCNHRRGQALPFVDQIAA